MNLKIMHPSTPKYVQLIEIIKHDIQNQVLVPEDKLPNEDDLAQQYGMSRGTVRKAIAELQRMGLVRKEQGRGTFVNEHQPALTGFSLVELDDYIRAQNRVPSTETRLFETLPATPSLAEKLNIDIGSDVIHLVQLRLASGMPIVHEERYFSKDLCPNITQNLIDTQPIHRVLIDTCDVPLVRLTHTIDMASLAEAYFDIFQVKQPVSIFKVDRLSYTKRDGDIHPAVWYRAIYRADEYQFHAQFHTLI